MTGIRDISGAYCPMGCGETLHLMTGGMMQCLNRGCPNSGAAQKILSDPEHVPGDDGDLSNRTGI